MKYHAALALIVCTLVVGCGEKESGAGPDKSTSAEPPAAPAAPVAVKHPLPGDPEAGAAVYSKICIACHQADGSGMNGMLAADFVKDKSRLAKSNEELLNSIRNGIIKDNRIMPPQKDILTPTEMADALSYVRKTFGS